MNETLKRLSEQFPNEETPEWGKCIVVPIKDFKREDEEKLKGLGFRVRFQAWRGQSCAFIGQEVQKTEPNQGTGRPWKAEEDARLKELLGHATHQEIGQKLGRTKTAIDQRIITLGLAVPRGQGRSGRFWTEEEDRIVKELHGTVRNSDIAQKLGRTTDAVAARVTTLRLNEEPAKIEPSPEITPENPEKMPEKKPENNDVRVKELLAASSVLYPDYRAAAALLLREAAKEMEVPT